MKKLTLIVLLLTATFMCNAQKIWSVSKDASQNADFSEIQAAVNAASPGDNIYVYPAIYKGFTLTIPLVIVGPGYFLGDNTNTQVNLSPAIVNGEVLVDAGTTGTVITGLTIQNKLTILSTSSILIKRNWILALQIKESININVIQNFIDGSALSGETLVSSCGSTSNPTSIYVGSNSSNINIFNNFIRNTNQNWCSPMATAICTYSTSSCYVKNNTIQGNLLGSNLNFENNILTTGPNVVLYSTGTYKNNIAYNTAFGTSSGNQANVNMTAVFVGSTANPSNDGQWQLKTGSPAKAAGVGGVDCGMFGGDNPYVLSGIPDIPAIYFFQSSTGASTTTGLPVHVKIKSRQ